MYDYVCVLLVLSFFHLTSTVREDQALRLGAPVSVFVVMPKITILG